MKLKEYQEAVLQKLERIIVRLAAERTDAEDYVAFQRAKGKTVAGPDWAALAWDALAAEGRLPAVRQADESLAVPTYIPRTDGLGRPIPNLCVKVPTGGGKTLLGCAALEVLFTHFTGRQTGLVLWVIPTDAIFRQTWNAFANRESGYRQRLERASGGKVKLLRKDDAFTREDTETHLCVMLIMLQAGAIREDSKDKRKLFQDSGRYPSFFPEADDFPANKALLQRVPNLDPVALDEDDYRGDQIMVRQSLNNVFRLLRPLVVMDEGHKAYGKASFDFLTGFNPSLILELSATPNGKERLSNVAVNVSGLALQQEEMIKLPIRLINDERADWKFTLEAAVEHLDTLQKAARRFHGDTDRHIRPILLVRVERTGKDQRDKNYVHAEDAREHLIAKLGAKPEQIRIKSSEDDQIGDEDLLAEACPVRFIITKDALREGWDCPFAYVLAVLSKTTAKTAITQMIGRVLRQPGARRTGVPALDQCYVFTFDQEVSDAVRGVQAGLADEGMGDLADQVQIGGTAKNAPRNQRTLRRAPKFSGVRVFLPRVLSKDPRGALRSFDYDRDLLSRVDWAALGFRARDSYLLGEIETYTRTVTAVSVEADAAGATTFKRRTDAERAIAAEGDFDLAAATRLLGDVIPNPWQAARILEETLASLRARGATDAQLQTHRLGLVQAIRLDLREQVNAATESIFKKLLTEEQIYFRLEVTDDPRLNWELAHELTVTVATNDHTLVRKGGVDLERQLFEVVYEKQFNGLERNLAFYLDAEKAVRWWHRLAVQQDWHLQGWQRAKVYPDFLVCLEQAAEEEMRFLVLETKGLHLKGNDDTEYKRRLFDLLSAHSASAVTAGEIKLGLKRGDLRFEMLLETDWEQKAANALATG